MITALFVRSNFGMKGINDLNCFHSRDSLHVQVIVAIVIYDVINIFMESHAMLLSSPTLELFNAIIQM